MKVTFKNVGQGDSLILEWEDAAGKKVGIIDCSKKDDEENPVIDHIGDHYKEIEFLILSHPHRDHYSGFNNLFDHIIANNIKVKKFIHTLNHMGEAFYKFLNWTETDTEDMRDLRKLVNRVNDLRAKDVIEIIEIISENWSEPIGENIVLKCLSPSQLEVEEYMKMVKLEPAKNKKLASASANYLSTLFSLMKGDKYHLLTSDCEVFTFERLLKQNKHKEFSEKSLDMGQLPHHGSAENHHKPFWDFIVKSEDRHAVASSGLHLKYEHPDFNVLKTFYEDGFTIHATNVVHGSKEFLDHLRKLAKMSKRLDTVSKLVDNYTAGDKSFTLN